MTIERPGYQLGLLLSQASPDWLALALVGDQSPAHQILSQVIAILGGSTEDIEYVSAKIENSSGSLVDAQVDIVLFTSDLVLRSSLVKGKAPILSVTRRDNILGIDVRSAPIVTFQTEQSCLEVTVRYQAFSLDLPYVTDYADRRRFEEFFPKIVDDLRDGALQKRT